MEEHSTAPLKICWYSILDWVCVWTCSSYESTMNSFQLHVKLKYLSPHKEPWSPVGKSDLLTNSDCFLQLK